MRDPFCEKEWEHLCGRLEECGEHLSPEAPSLIELCKQKVDEFGRQEAPPARNGERGIEPINTTSMFGAKVPALESSAINRMT